MYLVTPSPVPIAKSSMAVMMDRFGMRKNFAKGSEIFSQGENAEWMHAVVCGAVRTTRVLTDGRRQIGDFYLDGDMIGLESGVLHRFSAEALTNCSIRVIGRATILSACRGAAYGDVLLEATQRELERIQKHLLALECKTACERVASFLLGFSPKDAAQIVRLPMGRRDIADYLDLTLETVSRMISHLQVLAVVEFNGPRDFKVLSRDALKLLAA